MEHTGESVKVKAVINKNLGGRLMIQVKIPELSKDSGWLKSLEQKRLPKTVKREESSEKRRVKS